MLETDGKGHKCEENSHKLHDTMMNSPGEHYNMNSFLFQVEYIASSFPFNLLL